MRPSSAWAPPTASSPCPWTRPTATAELPGRQDHGLYPGPRHGGHASGPYRGRRPQRHRGDRRQERPDLGQLIYFFEYGCGLSGYLIDVNPFDQPAWRHISRTCSPSWASPATRTGRPSWRPNWRNKDKSGASGAAFSAAGGQKVNVKYQQTLNLLFCIVFYSVLCYA